MLHHLQNEEDTDCNTYGNYNQTNNIGCFSALVIFIKVCFPEFFCWRKKKYYYKVKNTACQKSYQRIKSFFVGYKNIN